MTGTATIAKPATTWSLCCSSAMTDLVADPVARARCLRQVHSTVAWVP